MTVMAHRPNDGLPAFVNIYVLNNHLLADLSAVAVQCFHLGRELAQQFRGAIDAGIQCLQVWTV